MDTTASSEAQLYWFYGRVKGHAYRYYLGETTPGAAATAIDLDKTLAEAYHQYGYKPRWQ